jgi:hypothetical protein
MGIQAKAGVVSLHMRNTNREAANPPVVFPSIKPGEDFSWCVWIRPTIPKIPLILTVHSCVDGSQTNIGHDGNLWLYSARNAAVGLPTNYFWGVTFDAWQLLCFSKQGTKVNMYLGAEDTSQFQFWTIPVGLQHVLVDWDNPIDSDLDYMMLLCNAGNAIAGFKIWHAALTRAEFESQGQQWHGNPTIGPRPFWVSPLRVPGDVSNVQDPYTGQFPIWNHGHEYTKIDPSIEDLMTVADPAYIANSSMCNAWLYPNKFPNLFVDPGTMPVVETIYKSPLIQLIQFLDVGSIATMDHQIASIDYYAAAFSGIDPGTPMIECWGLYYDEVNAEITDMSNVDYRIYPGDTKVVIPPGSVTPIKGSTVYFWKFGAQFKYPPGLGEANSSNLAYMYLYVTFQGYPTGVKRAAEDSMTGLFVIAKNGDTLDRFNRGLERKIPDPAVRTAYIGE